MEKRVSKRVEKQLNEKLAGARPKRRTRTAAQDIREAEIEAMREKALTLRLKSMTYTAIGKALGISAQRASQLVRKAIEDIPAETAELHRSRGLLEVENDAVDAHRRLGEIEKRLARLTEAEALHQQRADARVAALQDMGAKAENAERAALAVSATYVKSFALLQQTAHRYKDQLIKLREQHAKYTGAYVPERHEVLDIEVSPAMLRDMSDEDVQKIAAGDFTPLTRPTPAPVGSVGANGSHEASRGPGDRGGAN